MRPAIVAHLSHLVKQDDYAQYSHDEAFIREVLQKNGVHDTVYVTANTYDGGYEVRAGTVDVFVEYETIDDGDETTIMQRYAKR